LGFHSTTKQKEREKRGKAKKEAEKVGKGKPQERISARNGRKDPQGNGYDRPTRPGVLNRKQRTEYLKIERSRPMELRQSCRKRGSERRRGDKGGGTKKEEKGGGQREESRSDGNTRDTRN